MKGFTLVETVVALFILALLALFVTGVFPQLHRSVELSRGHSQAAHLGRSLLEAARRQEFPNLASWSGACSIPGEVAGRISTLEFTYAVDVVELAPGLKRVGAEVRWTTSSGGKRVDVQTEIASPGPTATPGTPAPSPGGAPNNHGGSGGLTPNPPPPGGGGLVNIAQPPAPFQWHDHGHHYGNPNKPDQHSHGGH